MSSLGSGGLQPVHGAGSRPDVGGGGPGRTLPVRTMQGHSVKGLRSRPTVRVAKGITWAVPPAQDLRHQGPWTRPEPRPFSDEN